MRIVVCAKEVLDPDAVNNYALGGRRVLGGAGEIVAIPLDLAAADYHVVARLLAAYIRSSGGADLVLCGRQASDDDQGVVPALIGEILSMPVVTVARSGGGGGGG